MLKINKTVLCVVIFLSFSAVFDIFPTYFNLCIYFLTFLFSTFCFVVRKFQNLLFLIKLKEFLHIFIVTDLYMYIMLLKNCYLFFFQKISVVKCRLDQDSTLIYGFFSFPKLDNRPLNHTFDNLKMRTAFKMFKLKIKDNRNRVTLDFMRIKFIWNAICMICKN